MENTEEMLMALQDCYRKLLSSGATFVLIHPSPGGLVVRSRELAGFAAIVPRCTCDDDAPRPEEESGEESGSGEVWIAAANASLAAGKVGPTPLARYLVEAFEEHSEYLGAVWASDGTTTGAVARAVDKATAPTVRRILEGLEGLGLVENRSAGKWARWHLTEAGEILMQVAIR